MAVFSFESIPLRCQDCPVIRNVIFNRNWLIKSAGAVALGDDGLNVTKSLSWVEKLEEETWSLLTELVVICEDYKDVEPYGCRVPISQTPSGVW